MFIVLAVYSNFGLKRDVEGEGRYSENSGSKLLTFGFRMRSS